MKEKLENLLKERIALLAGKENNPGHHKMNA